LKVALISLDQKWEDKACNLQRCAELTSRAAMAGANLVIFPEMTLSGFTMNAQFVAEDPLQSPQNVEYGTGEHCYRRVP